jgi:hypothetical protein
MDAPHDAAPDPAASQPPPGELVLQNGRLSGARRALNAHVTLVGQAPGCDVRLDVQGVCPVHCLVVHSPAGLVVRDLQTEGGTYVNGERVTLATLDDGDVLAVGPFRFKLRLRALDALPDPDALGREREALRIQAAAVAAQQAALTEEELRLQRRQVALEQQEAQLGALLEDKRQRLTELRDQARQARAELQRERAAYEEHLAATAKETAAARREIAAGRQEVESDRRRLLELWRRLKQRWHRHWIAERASVRRREQELAARARELEQRQERLQRGRALLHQHRLRLNGEAELVGRNLEAAWEVLHRAQRDGRAACQARQAALDEQLRQVAARATAVAAAERTLAFEGQRWQEQRLGLRQEMDGLENRIQNQRRKLLDHERELARREAVSAPDEDRAPQGALVASGPEHAAPECQPRGAEEDLRRRMAALERVAGELADQRLHLVEQYQRLAQAEHDWRQERAGVATQLEESGLRLQERERTLAARELALHAVERSLARRHEQAAHRQRFLEAWQTRLSARTAAWEAERDRLLADLQAREELSDKRLAVLTDLRRRWHRSRRQQLERLRADRAACERLGLDYVALREELLSRRAVLEQEERTLAEWGMALDDYRKEYLDAAADPESTAAHLQEIRQRCADRTIAVERGLAEERRALQAEAARLAEGRRELEQRADRLAADDVDLAERQAALEQQQTVAEDEHCQLRQQIHSLHRQRDRSERELQELRDELERVVRVLLEEAEPSVPLSKAA